MLWLHAEWLEWLFILYKIGGDYMNYIMKLGVLYKENFEKDIAKIRSAIIGTEKNIYVHENEWIAKTNIRNLNPDNGNSGDVRFREYVMLDREERVIVSGHPDYAKEENPDKVGWPAVRVPRVDHAEIYIEEERYILEMHDSQNYSLMDSNGKIILQIMHKGICGGWNLVTDYNFLPEIICALFLFCRYIEKENELLII